MASSDRPRNPDASSRGWQNVTGPLYLALAFQVAALLLIFFSDSQYAGSAAIGGTIGCLLGVLRMHRRST